MKFSIELPLPTSLENQGPSGSRWWFRCWLASLKTRLLGADPTCVPEYNAHALRSSVFVARTERHLTGIYLEETGVVDEAAKNARLMFERAVKTVSDLASSSTGIEIKALSTVCDPHLLVHQLNQRKRQAERSDEAKVLDRASRKCKNSDCLRTQRTSSKRGECASKQFRMCPSCLKQPTFALIFRTPAESCTPLEHPPQKSQAELTNGFEFLSLQKSAFPMSCVTFL